MLYATNYTYTKKVANKSKSSKHTYGNYGLLAY